MRPAGIRHRLPAALIFVGLVACGEAPAPPPAASPTLTPGVSRSSPGSGSKVFPLRMAPALDHPERDAWQRPDEVMAALAVAPGSRVADVGCGTGYFTLRLVDAVGPSGKVVAVDIQQGMLDRLAARLDPERARVVELRRSEPLRPLEPADGLDLVLCANTFHEVDDDGQAAFMRALAAAIRPGGRLVMLNWLPWRAGPGPPLANRIAPQRVQQLAREAGLVLAHDLDLLPTHSFLVFTRPGEPAVGEASPGP